MASPPVLTSIIKRGVVPVLKPLEQDSKAQQNVVPLTAKTKTAEAKPLNIDELERIIDARLKSLKIDLMNDLKQVLKNK